jgi:hypothetical protein
MHTNYGEATVCSVRACWYRTGRRRTQFLRSTTHAAPGWSFAYCCDFFDSACLLLKGRASLRATCARGAFDRLFSWEPTNTVAIPPWSWSFSLRSALGCFRSAFVLRQAALAERPFALSGEAARRSGRMPDIGETHLNSLDILLIPGGERWESRCLTCRALNMPP